MVYDDCTEDAGRLLSQQGPGGVKIVTTDTTGKTAATSRSFVCRRRSRPGPDAATELVLSGDE